MADQRFYPLAPLAEAVGEPLHALGRLLGLSGSSWTVVRDRGATERAAERYAVRLGVAPLSVWPDMVEEALVPCAECGEPFLPVRRGHSYCSHNCRERRRMRAKYQSDPEWREARLAARRAYYAECAEYEKADAARRYWADPERQREARRQRYLRSKGEAA